MAEIGLHEETIRQLFSLISASGATASPHKQSALLEMIVESAAEIIGSEAGALFLVDQEGESLTFEVAIGPQADAVRDIRVSMEQGIAGLVASTGQPLAISNAREDSRHAADIAEAVDYRPETILCVPLIASDAVIGVLELLDKNHGDSFSPRDIEILSLFADIAAVAIQQQQTQSSLTDFFMHALRENEVFGSASTSLSNRVSAYLQDVEMDPIHRQVMEMAHMVQAIAWRSDRERQLCYELLTVLQKAGQRGYPREATSEGLDQ